MLNEEDRSGSKLFGSRGRGKAREVSAGGERSRAIVGIVHMQVGLFGGNVPGYLHFLHLKGLQMDAYMNAAFIWEGSNAAPCGCPHLAKAPTPPTPTPPTPTPPALNPYNPPPLTE